MNNDIEEPTHGHEKYNTSQIFITSGYVKVRESLYTRVLNTILNHIDTRAI